MIQRRFVVGTLSSLAEFVEHTGTLAQVRKAELSPGDRVLLVKTCNSVYSIRKVDGERCLVSGGWFDRHGLTPAITAVAGCTWGGLHDQNGCCGGLWTLSGVQEQGHHKCDTDDRASAALVC
jgi:hypothetical protein